MPKLLGDKPLTAAERSRRYRERHPERAKASQKKYDEANPERRRQISRDYYERNAEVERAKDAAWREANRELSRQRARESYWRNVESARSRRHLRRLRAQEFVVLPQELRRLYSEPCVACGSEEDMTIDHIVPLSRGGSHSVGNLQSLCFSCNASKNNRLMVEWRAGKVVSRKVA